MSGADRKANFDLRLAAHFATLRVGRPAHWQVYAAVTGSAMAMAGGLSAAAIASEAPTASPSSAKVLPGTNNAATLRSMPMFGAIRAAMNRTAQTQAGPPSIQPNGVVPLYGTTSVIQPGEWISIYGSNLAVTTMSWDGDFPILLGGTSVTINGKSGYLYYVSPNQINLQAPDDPGASGTVPVVVTTAAGSATTTVTLSAYAPSFELSDAVHVSGIILRPKGNGAYGGGAYDLLGPTATVNGIRKMAAQPGDTVELFAVGFGPTLPAVPAGQAFTGAAKINSPFSLYINNVQVTPGFVGISEAGVYQINLTVPSGLGEGDVPIVAGVGGLQTQTGVLFPLAPQAVPIVSSTHTFVSAPSPPPPPIFFTSSPPPPATSGGGGGGSNGSANKKKHTWHPKLTFPQKTETK